MSTAVYNAASSITPMAAASRTSSRVYAGRGRARLTMRHLPLGLGVGLFPLGVGLGLGLGLGLFPLGLGLGVGVGVGVGLGCAIGEAWPAFPLLDWLWSWAAGWLPVPPVEVEVVARLSAVLPRSDG